MFVHFFVIIPFRLQFEVKLPQWVVKRHQKSEWVLFGLRVEQSLQRKHLVRFSDIKGPCFMLQTAGATATQSKTKKPAVWNREDDMARKIQSAYRRYKYVSPYISRLPFKRACCMINLPLLTSLFHSTLCCSDHYIP